MLSTQVSWSERIDTALDAANSEAALTAILNTCKTTLDRLADTVLLYQPPVRRKKLEHLITEIVHQRDTTQQFITDTVNDPNDFQWLAQMRYYFNPKESDILQQLSIKIANADFFYGFEYLGVGEKLIQTPLTDVAYTTLTQGLKARQGGAPFGPAGTGKTESVKMLARQLGRLCLVFNCDETFDSEAMQRILMGLCQVGAFGCFDEFNRLEEAQLSAVSQQIQSIQESLVRTATESNVTVEVVSGKPVPLNEAVGIFITMNPGYAGRSNLPDNLKKLFRNLAMTVPDKELIAEVMLFGQGFRTAHDLAKKVVPLFKLCGQQLSNQPHYDFGLRGVKAVLISAGNIKRERLAVLREDATKDGGTIDEDKIANMVDERDVLIQSVSQTMVPKLVGADNILLQSLLSDVFPGATIHFSRMEGLRAKIEEVCKKQHYVTSEKFMEKLLQLYQVTEIAHGLMMVGPSGAGKTAAWTVLLEALKLYENSEAQSYVIDPKALSKDELYGFLDPTTREWTDGVFTSIVRKIIDNKLGELNKRQWIIFDGDVDPEWVENLNSVLDDNKLLTLPNGERLALPKCLRVMFEVQDLKYATLATVSRCGMIWFSDDILDLDMHFKRFLMRYRNIPLDQQNAKTSIAVQEQVADILEQFFTPGGLVEGAMQAASEIKHIMVYSHMRAMNSLFCVLQTVARNIITFNQNQPDFPMAADMIEKYVTKQVAYYIMWSFAGDTDLKERKGLSDYLAKASTIDMPNISGPDDLLIDYHVALDGPRACEWALWADNIPQIEINPDDIAGTDTVIPTVDTERHVDLLYTWLIDHLPVVLCGPPGSGKTMTLFNALRRSNDFIVALVNFSSSTTPQVLMETFAQHCVYNKTVNGLVLEPREPNKWLVVFCDECNLPATDKYNTVRVITFMRQLVERQGFWKADTLEWVNTSRIQFVGACNPPTDPGRVPLAMRFLRHVPVIYVDYPSAESYKQIFGTYNRALMKRHPECSKYAEPLTDAMVDFFMQTQERFTSDMQPFYIYSPREMTRWVKGIKECVWNLDSMSVEELIRIWAHEALRLFGDRLVFPEELKWTEKKIDEAAEKHFPGADTTTALQRPILFSSWMNKHYVPVELEPLRDFVHARLKVFHEEALDVPLVLFDDVLDHVLRIDRIFKQNQGHVLMIGVAGGGKTTLSRFVAWMNGLTVFQVKVHNMYTADDFDEDLRVVLRRAGCENEKIAFIMDEGNIMDTAFLERINTLLANGEVPGLFEKDEYASLMTQCKQASAQSGEALDGESELYHWFSKQIMKNLHVVFTMNPAEGGMQDRASTSPALFNRCVLDWFGDWSDPAAYQVATEFTINLDLEKPDYQAPMAFPSAFEQCPQSPSHREAVNNAFVHVHLSAKQASREMRKREGRATHITPRHLLEAVNQFVTIYKEKCSKLEEEKRHLGVGLRKLQDTFAQVGEMKKTLAGKRIDLQTKDSEAAAAMDKMVNEQTIANEAKREAEVLAKELVSAIEGADSRKAQVSESLAHVEPAVQAAEAAVGDIKKDDISTIKSYANPTAVVKTTLEAVCIMLKENVKDWRAIKSVIIDPRFRTRVMEHDSGDVTDKVKEKIKKLLGDKTKEENIKAATRASAATGALMTWTLAKLEQIEVMLTIEPLRNELKGLVAKVDELNKKETENTAKLAVLEKNLAIMKREFGELEAAKQVIKIDLSNTESKVGRAQELLDSLSGEKTRWTQQDQDFADAMKYIIGDSLLAACFLAYAGYFNQTYRDGFQTSWTRHLEQANIEYSRGLSVPDYLGSPEMQLRWEQNGLPTDDLCSENAIMIERGIRYPLVIDPAGQAKSFLLNQFKDQKVLETSFTDPGFRKSLESAVRFGTPLIVRDAEKYDPIMNPVLNREYKRTGGRILITLGDQEIDLSPNVSIVLTASTPSFEFPPDLTSRVTMANFTVTRSSLQSQCLTAALKAERPDVDAKRTDLLKQNGEFRAKLFALENSLLQSLNEAEGSLLDDDKVTRKLEIIKKEAAEIAKKVEGAEEDMKQIRTTEEQYRPLARNCSDIFFLLEQLCKIKFFYRHSLNFFLAIFNTTLLENKNLDGVKDADQRLKIILGDLFAEVYRRTAPGMLDADRLTFAMELARLFANGTEDQASPVEIERFLSGGSVEPGAPTGPFSQFVPDIMDTNTAIRANDLSKAVPCFGDLCNKLAAIKGDVQVWMDAPRPEDALPDFGQSTEGAGPGAVAYRELLVVQALRPDRVISKATSVVETIMGKGFMAEQHGSLQKAIESQVDARTPILLFGTKGYDPSTNVQDIAGLTGKRRNMKEISVGSASAFDEAYKAIDGAAKKGEWVMLKNVHLAPKSLDALTTKLVQLNLHQNFRLFLTTEIQEKLPKNLLMNARKAVFEPASGVKESLKRTLTSLSQEDVPQEPAERGRMYLLVAWLHAVVQERLRYTPLGWSKGYEFGEPDLRAAIYTVNQWMTDEAKGKSNLPPDKIPFAALRELLAQAIYGGRVDNAIDDRLLKSFVDSIFVPETFKYNHPLVEARGDDMPAITMPEGTKLEQYVTL